MQGGRTRLVRKAHLLFLASGLGLDEFGVGLLQRGRKSSEGVSFKRG
jgi:hypothetical protein